MFRTSSSRLRRSLAMLAVLVVVAPGCGGQNESTGPVALENPDEITAVLPKGVTLETPVVPDKVYGESSKTVGEALATMRARVKDGVLVSGYVGPKILFDSEPAAKQKPAGKSKKGEKPPAVIHLAH